MKLKFSLVVVTSFALSLLILVIIFLVGNLYDVPFEALTGDPANFYKFHPLSGFLSNIGVLLWCATASICIFSGLTFKNEKHKDADSGFFIFAGLLTMLLLVDDFFMLHDHLLRQKPMYLLYAISLVYLFFKYHQNLRQHQFLLFLTAIGFFFVSMVMDSVLPSKGLEYFFEDGFKFLGIVSWTLFFVKRASLAKEFAS